MIKDKLSRLAQNNSFHRLGTSLAALLLSLIIGGIIIAIIGTNPFKAYGLMLKGAFGSFKNVANTIASSIPLMFAGLAVAIASKAGKLNL
jgi:ABC-type uncharacterized transport system permease subunit